MFGLFWGSVQKRVARGVALLDAYDPEWFNRVDTDRLRMEDVRLCVLAQVVGQDYDQGLTAFGLSCRKSMKYGFDGYRGDEFTPNPWNELRREWVRVIDNKRNDQFHAIVQDLEVHN